MIFTRVPRLALLAVAALFSLATIARAQDMEKTEADVEYAEVDGKSLAFDLYMPPGVDNPPLIVQIHGGAWRFGDKNGGVPFEFVDAGYAVASVEFRQASEAPFPAQIHDIKAAIRYLRGHASTYGFNAEKIAITGASSGAHLAVLVGVTNGHPELEGNVGHHNHDSSDVQAILSYFAATDLTTILDQSTPFGLNLRTTALDFLLGGQPADVPELAKLASPVYHVDANDPPLILFHGDRDPQMPINQSLQMLGAYQDAGLDVKFVPVHGAVHGGPQFFDEKHLPMAIEFLNRTMK
jgi:acetyl esterase/lipase